MTSVRVGQVVDEITPNAAGGLWSVDKAGQLQNASSATILFPSLTPANAVDMYWGYALVANSFSGSNGTPTGYTYNGVDQGCGITWDGTVNLTSGTPTQPSGTQTAGWADSVGMLISATVEPDLVMAPFHR